MEDPHFYSHIGPVGRTVARLALLGAALTGCYGAEPVIPEAPDPAEWAAYADHDHDQGIDPDDGVERDRGVRVNDAEPLTDATISGACSVIGGAGTQWTVRSNRPGPLKLWWVNFECNEVPYGDVFFDAPYVQMSFVDHVWRIRDAQTGQLVTEVVLDTTPAQLTEVD